MPLSGTNMMSVHSELNAAVQFNTCNWSCTEYFALCSDDYVLESLRQLRREHHLMNGPCWKNSRTSVCIMRMRGLCRKNG